MVAGMSPALDRRTWRFIAVNEDALPGEAFALIREDILQSAISGLRQKRRVREAVAGTGD
jgi:hypothetical protein